MAETASCAGRGTGLASSTCQSPRSSVPRQPASRPATPSQRGSNHSGPSGPPCGQEPFDDLAARVPVATAGMQRRDHARPSSHARLRCTGIRDRLADRRGARGARPRSAAERDRGLERLPRSRPPPRRGRRLRRSPRPRRGGDQGTGGAARVAPAHGPRARASTRAACSRTHPSMRSRCSSVRRRSGPSTRRSAPSGCSRVERASRPSGSPRSSAMRTGGSAPSTSPGSAGRSPESWPSCRRPGSRLRARPSPPAASSSLTMTAARERSSPASSRDTPRVRSSRRALENPRVDGGKLLLL